MHLELGGIRSHSQSPERWCDFAICLIHEGNRKNEQNFYETKSYGFWQRSKLTRMFIMPNEFSL